MSKSKSKKSRQRYTTTAILALLFFVGPVCVSPEAIKTDIQGIRNDMGQLENLVDQKADNSVVAEQIGEVNNRIDQTTQLAENLSVWRKTVIAENIQYSGAGWVVVGTGVMAIIFVGAGLLLVRAFMKRGNMLTLLTRAVQKSGNATVVQIKKNLKTCVHKGYHCKDDIESLGKFAKKRGTFSEQE